MNESLRSALQQQATQIYANWELGNKSLARTMMRQVPFTRQAYVTTVMCALAHQEGMQYAFAKFIEEYTT